MAIKGDIYKVALPNGNEYNFKDKYVRENYRALNNNDFDTINVTELNSGNIINTGAARFLNTINGSISGNAATATKATQDSDGSVINTTYAKKSGTTFTGRVAYNNISMPLSAGKVTSLAAGTTEIFKDGIAISNPATFYDVGWIRVTGTSESDTVLEIATGDDGGMTNCEKTVVRQYNTSNVVAREAVLLNTDGTSSFPVSVTSPKFIGALQGNAATATKATQDESGNNIKATYGASLSNSGSSVVLYNKNSASLGSVSLDTLLTNLPTWSADPTDDTYFIRRDTSGSAQYGQLKFSTVWNYIKGKADSTYLASTTKYAGSSSVGGAANSANQLNDDTSYINSGTSYVTHTTVSTLRPFLTRFNNVGIGTESHGCLVLSNNWSSNVYNAELLLGMGDRPYIYFRGKNNGTYTTWLPVGKFSAVPTTGQVVITDGTEGGIKSSGYTIAKSVPSNAVFTDQNVNQSATTTSNWRKIVLSYQDAASAGTAVTANTNVVYVTPNAEIQPSTGNIRSAGTISATILSVTASNGSSGGISLYAAATNMDNYGIYFRQTSNKEKHGYVTSDWATYFTMSDTDNRGWVFRRNKTGGNVASINTSGNMVLNGSLTLGGNQTNTSGVRQVYNATTQSLDFVFVA